MSTKKREDKRSIISPLFAGTELGRRDFFRIAGTGVAGSFLVPALRPNVYAKPAEEKPLLTGRARNCIFIHMQGAPSHVDTFDLKVGSWTPTTLQPETINGILFPKGLMPTLAGQVKHMAILRSVRAPALVHSLQQIWTQVSRNPTSQMGKISPNIGSIVAREFEPERQPNQKLPGFISLNGGSTVNAGYFNARYTPFGVAANAGGLSNLTNAVGQVNFERRYQMLMDLDASLRANSPLGESVLDMDGFYQQSRAMMYNPEVDTIFKFTTDEGMRYGNSGFGNSCIVARNLLRSNQGTRYIQLNIGGWDNHTNIYASITGPARQFDLGLGNLVADLMATPGQRGGTLFDETLIVAMGEFGRTVRTGTNQPGLNNTNGRDHYFQHFSLFMGGGVSGGQAIGKTTDDGFAIADPGWAQKRAIANEDIAASIYSALGIDYTKTLWDDPYGRGFDLVPFAKDGAWYPVLELYSRQVRAIPDGPTRGPRRVS